MVYLANVPKEYIWFVLGVAVLFTIIVIWIRSAEEVDEDEHLFNHLNGLDREIRKPWIDEMGPSAGNTEKK